MRFFLLVAIVTSVACNSASKKRSSDTESLIDSLKRAGYVDSIVKSNVKNVLLDTSGVYKSPIQVLKATLYKESYSNYKSISLTYKNVSDKKVEAIRFSWYGEDAFGEPADMGSYSSEGFGGGFDDDPISPGKTRTSSWSILSSRGKKVVMAWAFEVVFADGTKWELSNEKK